MWSRPTCHVKHLNHYSSLEKKNWQTYVEMVQGNLKNGIEYMTTPTTMTWDSQTRAHNMHVLFLEGPRSIHILVEEELVASPLKKVR